MAIRIILISGVNPLRPRICYDHKRSITKESTRRLTSPHQLHLFLEVLISINIIIVTNAIITNSFIIKTLTTIITVYETKTKTEMVHTK